MKFLSPKAIMPEMFGAGTSIPAVDADAGELAWASGADCAQGDRRVRGNYTYECIKAVAGAPANTYAPDTAQGGEFWFKDELAPTNRWAPFDQYMTTTAKALGQIKYVITPGFVNGVAIHNIQADSLTMEFTDGEGGPPLAPPVSADMWQQAYGLWEYLFGELRMSGKANLKDVPLHPNLCITITASRTLPTEEVSIGYIKVGTWKQLLLPNTEIGATVTGASAEPKSYSYFKQADDGTYTIRRGRQAVDISLNCVVAEAEANRALDILKTVLDVPVPIEASELAQFAWLSTVGLVTGRVVASDKGIAEVEIKVKGNV